MGDLLCLVGVADPQTSPTGDAVAYVRKMAGEGSKIDSSIWSVAVPAAARGRAAEPRRLTTGPKDSLPRYSPDGTRLAFVRGSMREGRDGDAGSQIALLPLDGGEPTILTKLPEGSIRAMRWMPDGRSLAIAFRETEPEWTAAAKRERAARGASDPPRVLDDRWYRLDGDGYFGAARHRLLMIDAGTGRSRLLYDGDAMGTFDFDVAPDGARIAIATNRDRDALIKPWKSEIVLLDVASGRVQPLAGLPIGPKAAVAWSPDGRRLAWAGRIGRDSSYSTENLELFVCTAPPRTTSARAAARSDARSLTHRHDICLAAATLSDCAEAAFDPAVRWRPDGAAILTRIGDRGSGRLVEIALDGSAPRFLSEAGCEIVLGTVAPDGSVAALRSDPTTPAEVGLLVRRRTVAEWRPLTALNAALMRELSLATPKEITVTASDGHRSQLWILEPPEGAAKPKGRGRSQRRPAILEIHGGPHAMYGNTLFIEFQLLAAQGYIVAYGNPRGSKGYGRDHCAAIRGSWGDKDWLDIQAYTDALRARRDVDPERIGVMGGSYGGYMTNWAIAHDRRYRAAITDRCVSNLLSMAGNSDFVTVPDEYWIGGVYDRPEAMWRSSPIAHFKGVRTPTLIIHSEGDLRCNIEQAEQVHSALVLQGVPTRFVRYPASTSHGMSRSGPPDLRVHRLNEILAWWERWLR